MSNNVKTFIGVLAVVILVSGGLIFMSSKNSKDNNDTASTENNGEVAGTSTTDSEYSASYVENLAKFITEKGMVLYGAYWCPHCKDQKKAFGDAVQYIDYVECDAKGTNANPDECIAQGIESYPTWIYQGKKYSGYQTLSELAKIVGFTEQAQ